MPDLVEQMYCSQQIVIPPSYPYILKRYCKAAIKTQPYDLLRWSFEYFKALAQRTPPPVKLRLEYPIYSTEGGLTRGYLKVLANQLLGMTDVPMTILKNCWQGFCLDQQELNRVFCLCEVYMRSDSVPLLHFIAVAGGLLTKSLTHTMILLCETLTKEPDGGSAAIPLEDFLTMYNFLAKMDASKDVRYYDGYREGHPPAAEEVQEEDETHTTTMSEQTDTSDDYWCDSELQRVRLIDDHVARTTRLSMKLNLPVVGEIERSPSIERAKEIERENFMRDWRGKSTSSLEIDKSLRKMASEKMGEEALQEEEKIEERPVEVEAEQSENDRTEEVFDLVKEQQASLTSAELIGLDIKNEIEGLMNAEIALIPDAGMTKKEANEEEVQMIQNMVQEYFDENMEIIIPEAEEELDEGLPIPVVIQVFAVPGIGPPVDSDIVGEFRDYALEVSKVQADVFMPRNMRHFMCPPLEKYVEYDYGDKQTKKEELATGGVITD